MTNRFAKVVEKKFCTPCFRKERNNSRKKEKKDEKEEKVESAAITFLSGILNSKSKKKRQLIVDIYIIPMKVQLTLLCFLTALSA